MDPCLPVGIFDSGVGGLTVLKALNELLPNESLVYLGDTARVPYGTKSPEVIIRYSLMAAGKLARMGIKALVIACNTATSAALPKAVETFAPMPVIGVIEPGARAAVAATSGHIAVMATEATISGGAYQRAIERLRQGTIVSGRACTLLVPLAEEGWLSGAIAEGIILRYLDGLFTKDAPPDTLLLGCTHFPLFRETLRKLVGPEIHIVDSASATALAAERALESNGLLNPSKKPGEIRFFTTDYKGRFARTGSLFLQKNICEAEVELLDL